MISFLINLFMGKRKTVAVSNPIKNGDNEAKLKEFKKKLAESYISAAKDEAKSVNSNALLIIVSLIGILFTGIQDNYEKLIEKRKINEQIQITNIRIEEKKAQSYLLKRSMSLDSVQRNRITLNKDNKGLSDIILSNNPNKKDSLISVSIDSLNAQLRQLNLKKDELKLNNKNLDLPFGLKIPAKAYLHSTIWSFLLLVSVWYITQTRLKILNFSSKAIRIFRRELNYKEIECADILSNLPFWLAPIPKRENRISENDLSIAFGWKLSSTQKRVKKRIIILLILSMLIQLWVFYVGYEVLQDQDGDLKINYRRLVLAVNLFLIGATIFYFIFWFKPILIPDYYTDEEFKKWDRRDFIKFFGITLIGPLVYYLLPFQNKENRDAIKSDIAGLFNSSKSNIKKVNNPRYKRKKSKNETKTQLSPGFHKRKNNNVIHYVNYSKRIKGVNEIKDNKLDKIDIDKVLKTDVNIRLTRPYLHLKYSSYAFETEALQVLRMEQKLNDNKYMHALNLLKIGIRHDLKRITNPKLAKQNPSYRLYDLAAILSIRYDEGKTLQDIIKKIRDDEKLNKMFIFRVNKWEDESISNKWIEKWKSSNNNLNWGKSLKVPV